MAQPVWQQTHRSNNMLLFASGTDIELEEGQHVLRAADGGASLRHAQRRRRRGRYWGQGCRAPRQCFRLESKMKAIACTIMYSVAIVL